MRLNRLNHFYEVCLSILFLIGLLSFHSFDTYAAAKYDTKYNYSSSGSTVTITQSGRYIDTISHSGGHVQPQMAFAKGVAYYTVKIGDSYYLCSKDLNTKNTHYYRRLPNEYQI